MQSKLAQLKAKLESISKQGTFEQIKEIWPVVWMQYGLLAEMAAELENLKKEQQP